MLTTLLREYILYKTKLNITSKLLTNTLVNINTIETFNINNCSESLQTLTTTIKKNYQLLRNQIVNKIIRESTLTINNKNVNIQTFLYENVHETRKLNLSRTACKTINDTDNAYVTKNEMSFVEYNKQKGDVIINPLLDDIQNNSSFNFVIRKNNDIYELVLGRAHEKAELGIKHDMISQGMPLYFGGELTKEDNNITFNFLTSGFKVPRELTIILEVNDQFIEMPGYGLSLIEGMKDIIPQIKEHMATFFKHILKQLSTSESTYNINYTTEGIHYHYPETFVNRCFSDEEITELNKYFKDNNYDNCIDLESKINDRSSTYVEKDGTSFKCKPRE